MTWLTLDKDGDLDITETPQGQSMYTGADTVIATTGSFHKAHGDGAAIDEDGNKYPTQRSYLQALLGKQYDIIFNLVFI